MKKEEFFNLKKEKSGKICRNYKGIYIIEKKLGDYTLKIKTPKGKILKSSYAADDLLLSTAKEPLKNLQRAEDKEEEDVNEENEERRKEDTHAQTDIQENEIQQPKRKRGRPRKVEKHLNTITEKENQKDAD